jgi:hypothetical protein
MDAILCLIRLPLFLIGCALLLIFPIVGCVLVVGLAPCVLPLAFAIWLVFLAFHALIAAVENDSKVLADFFADTAKAISGLVDPYLELIANYPRSFVSLFEWFVGTKKDAT